MSRLPQSGQARGTRFAQAAVVAAQRAVLLVEDAPGAAVRAPALPAAGTAVQHRRVAAAVEQQQALFAARQAFLQRAEQGRCEHALRPLGRLWQLPHVHQPHPGHGTAAHAFGQRQALVATLLHPLPGLQRWRGRTQQHGHALAVAAPDGQVARRIARTFLLLEGRVVLFVDDDQAQAWQRHKDGQPRAQHQIGLPQVGQQPVAQPLRGGQAAVQADQHAAWKTLGKARFELRREIDLGHQHQGLLPPAAAHPRRRADRPRSCHCR
jgi:hypothetical protein